jgi:bifunctional DNA-binding transcriptional regulator/antitoxin component of YhaV-PrlF toxin-antitoxin module
MSKQIRFSAILHEATVGTGGAFVLFPYDVEKTFGMKGRIPIKATVNGELYRGSLVKYGHPQHIFPVLKSIREKLGKKIGDSIEITMQIDNSERVVAIPADFHKILKANKLELAFDKMSYTHRKEYIKWIEDAKKAETRENRIVKAIEMIKDKAAK